MTSCLCYCPWNLRWLSEIKKITKKCPDCDINCSTLKETSRNDSYLHLFRPLCLKLRHYYIRDIKLLDRIKWKSEPPSLQIKDETVRKPNCAIFPSLIWGKGGSKFFIYFVQDCSYQLPKGQAVKLTFFALWTLKSVFTRGPSRYISELSINKYMYC